MQPIAEQVCDCSGNQNPEKIGEKNCKLQTTTHHVRGSHDEKKDPLLAGRPIGAYLGRRPNLNFGGNATPCQPKTCLMTL